MALPLWGQLEKAQDNPQTIEEAIAQAIAEHEADPEAHLGAGESLSMHKHEEVIDHPAGSVLLDKMTASETMFTFNPGQGGAFTRSGITAITGLTLLKLETEEAGTQTSQGTLIATPGYNPFTYDRDSLFETTIYFDLSGEEIQDVWAGITNNTTPGNSGYGFKWDGDRVRGFARFGSTTYYTSDLSVADRSRGIFRAMYVASEKTVYFFYNGIQVGSLYHASNNLATGTYFVFKLIGNGDEGSVANFLRLYAGGAS